MKNNKSNKSLASTPHQNHSKNTQYIVTVGYKPEDGLRRAEDFYFDQYQHMIRTLIYIFEGKHSEIKKDYNPFIIRAKHNSQDILWKVRSNVHIIISKKQTGEII